MIDLTTKIPELNIFFNELPDSGEFTPNYCVVNWKFKPVLSQAKDVIEDVIIDIKKLSLTYSFTSEITEGETTETLEILPNSEWDIEYTIARSVEDEYIEPASFMSISTINFFFQEKRIEVEFLN